MTEVIVVGGGPAGASLAILLGRQGFDVELYEQACFPREKPCGEGLLPPGVGVLRTLGLEGSVGGEPLGGVRYHVGEGSVRGSFEAPGARASLHGLGQRRLVFDEALFDTAKKTPRVRAYDGVRIDAALVENRRVAGILVDGEARRAGVVVAADGSSSRLRRSLGLERTARSRRVGIRAHFRRPHGHAPLTDVEIFLRYGYELYVTPLPGHEILVAALAHEDAARGDLRAAFRRWLEAEPLLSTWLDGAAQTSELAGRAPLVRRAAGKTPPGLILLGDAHASVDPITAGGMSVALVSAELLAREMRGVLEHSAVARRRFEGARGRVVRIHRLLGGCLLALSHHPRLLAVACRALELAPAAMGRLVRLVTKGA